MCLEISRGIRIRYAHQKNDQERSSLRFKPWIIERYEGQIAWGRLWLYFPKHIPPPPCLHPCQVLRPLRSNSHTRCSFYLTACVSLYVIQLPENLASLQLSLRATIHHCKQIQFNVPTKPYFHTSDYLIVLRGEGRLKSKFRLCRWRWTFRQTKQWGHILSSQIGLLRDWSYQLQHETLLMKSHFHLFYKK